MSRVVFETGMKSDMSVFHALASCKKGFKGRIVSSFLSLPQASFRCKYADSGRDPIGWVGLLSEIGIAFFTGNYLRIVDAQMLYRTR